MTSFGNRAPAASDGLENRKVFETLNAIEDDLLARSAAGTLAVAYFEPALARALAIVGDQVHLVVAIQQLRPDR